MSLVYDFNDQRFSGSYIGFPQELAWPFRLIRITIPKSSKEELNAIEICILKLLSCGIYNPDDLANEMCMPKEMKDMVNIVLARLVDIGKIDDQHHLYDQTKHEIEQYDALKESEPTEYETWTVFQECIGGNLLPMLKEAQLESEVAYEEGRNIIIEKGNNNKNVKLRKVRLISNGRDNSASQLPSQTATEHPLPSQTEIISVIKRCIEADDSFSDLSVYSMTPDYLKESQFIEKCFLRVRMVMRKNGEWRIINPFGKVWSLELESAYSKLLEENKKEESELIEWGRKNIDNDQQKRNGKNIYKYASYNTTDNWNCYPELIRKLNYGNMNNRGGEVKTDIYSAIEWALYYALKNCESTDAQLQQMLNDSEEQNEKRIMEAINNLNLSRPQKSIPSPYDNRLYDFQNNKKPEMQVVLPLALLVAQDNCQFEFNKVCQELPEILNVISKWKENRDKKKHGKHKFSIIYSEEDYSKMKSVISMLIPSISFTDSTSDVDQTNDNNVTDICISAKMSLYEIFGASSFEKMDNIIKSELLDAEINRNGLENDEFDALPCIDNLYAATQRTFSLILDGRSISTSSPISDAHNKAKEAGLGELPEALWTIGPTMLEKTLEGNDQTLGACIIAWLLITDISVLKMIAKKQSEISIAKNQSEFVIAKNQFELLPSLADLHTIRGHGNKSVMLRNEGEKERFNRLVNNIYKIIRTILEV